MRLLEAPLVSKVRVCFRKKLSGYSELEEALDEALGEKISIDILSPALTALCEFERVLGGGSARGRGRTVLGKTTTKQIEKKHGSIGGRPRGQKRSGTLTDTNQGGYSADASDRGKIQKQTSFKTYSGSRSKQSTLLKRTGADAQGQA